MFFENDSFSVRLLSVHLLTWQKRDVIIPPKRSFALSFREVGESRFIMNDGERIDVRNGDMLYFPKGCSYRIQAGQERVYAVNFEAQGDMPERIMKLSVKNTAFFSTAFSELLRVWRSRDSGYYPRAVSYFYRIISEIMREHEAESTEPVYRRLKPALSLMYSEYMNPELSVGTLAEHIGVSETYFRKIFEHCMGERPLEFLNKLRIDYAIELLETGFYNVESTAEMCGFCDPKYFSTVFKRVKGVSPSEYMKKHK